jgi:hypothetical protein
MRIHALVLMIVLISGISRGFGADEGVVAKNGDRYSLSKSKDSSGKTIYELQRTSPSDEVTTLWHKGPRTGPSPLPEPAPFLLSPIAAICDEGNEISLLVFTQETDALVFRFASSAATATPVKIRSLIRAGDPSHGLRFKRHGELVFENPVDSIEKLVRFDSKGNIATDFRPLLPGLGDFRLPGSTKSLETDRESPSANIDQGNQSSANPSFTNPPPSRNAGLPLVAAAEPRLESTSWPLWTGIGLGVLALLYLIFKKREEKE